MLAQFIVNLSHRFRSENDLSDVTWTMCQTSDRFQCVFLKFFFPSFDDDCSETILNREKSQDDSRVDFYFHYRKELFLIENKIYDVEHHFEQYCETYGIHPDHLGYIVNYHLEKPGFVVKTWKEFFHYLLRQIGSFQDEEQELVRSYIEYLKSVCSIFHTNKSMNLASLFSLYSFYNNLDKILDRKTDDMESISSPHAFSKPHEGRMGKGFRMKFMDIDEPITGWFGIYFDKATPSVWLYIDKQCLNKDYPFDPCDVYLYDGYYDSAFWFKYNMPSNFDELELNIQIKELSKFYNTVLMAFYKVKIS